MHGDAQQSDLLLPKEVAHLLRVQVSTVYSAATQGRLPAVRLWRGRRKSLLRFRRADIEAMINGKGPIRNAEGHRSTR
jgi:excisionase family DNA binding protein